MKAKLCLNSATPELLEPFCSGDLGPGGDLLRDVGNHQRFGDRPHALPDLEHKLSLGAVHFPEFAA